MPEKPKKQAIVVIHGMGEQKPMGTLRSFVRTVWRKDPFVAQGNGENEAWIKPDARAGLAELRRITTGENAAGVRSDFYEFYWADLMQGTTWQHLMSWIQGLLLRSPVTVPWDVFMIWITLWLISMGGIVLGLSSIPGIDVLLAEGLCKLAPDTWLCASGKDLIAWLGGIGKNFDPYKVGVLMALATAAMVFLFPWKALGHLRTWLTLPLLVLIAATLYLVVITIAETKASGFVISLLALTLLNRFLVPYFGDVARYVQARPENVERRKAVRDRGAVLLRDLHDCGRYNRIIVVAHSLGTIVAYDLLSLLWTEYGPQKNNPATAEARQAFRDLDAWIIEQGNANQGQLDVEAFQKRQRALAQSLARCPAAHGKPGPSASGLENSDESGSGDVKSKAWLVSDFITLGSPLTHAEFLLAHDKNSLQALIDERVLPSCPPVTEYDGDSDRRSFHYEADGELYPHHAALFAAVRWTNIYDPHNWLGFLIGDPISGRVSPNFGAGIKDVRVRIPKGSLGIPRLFTHTQYWHWRDAWSDGNVPAHITHLRHAVDLLDREKAR